MQVETRRRIGRILTWDGALALVGAVTAAAVAFGTFVVSSENSREERLRTIAAAEASRSVMEAMINQRVNETVGRLRGEATTTGSNAHNASSAELNSIRASLAEVSKRQSRLEDAISRDPARALELPLLRRDVDNLKDGQAHEIEAIRKSVDQVWDLNKWLLGGGAVSLLAIALSTLLARWRVIESNA